ncbi:hypothetical protein CONLIGDRAFT_686309 [Coniochaeta ligniaria NRRL 30616]|uniref:Uncharacterized protein n=1 Tax=Coniochaeta ligniaria NRRL 30616 TaxID=1408157 RepID=A0A1J7ISM5_9PEZI|nr:hypothetical protein CONLIGDRAFT_686309 [Coniochaeta ligniaria NRRL 30616]
MLAAQREVFAYPALELARQLETKEVKTWAELALKLGVDPPDQDRGQSSQKIQQYAVHLKRWMHSMHLDAFFDSWTGSLSGLERYRENGNLARH